MTTQQRKPIKTAPKDGAGILGVTEAGRVDVFRWEPQRYHKKPNPYWARAFHGTCYDRANQPTHWMPLPDPPSRGPAQDQEQG